MNNNGTVSIYLLSGFANYFNRRIFYYSTLEDYLTAVGSTNYELREDINFNPADGVKTYLDVAVNDDKYQYLLVVDSETGDILSRWWIVEADRNLGGQYRMSLRRDVVAESLGNTTFMTSAPIYVEKGQLADNDPFIFNSEGMNFNQIKKSEELLKLKNSYGFDIDIAFIVGFMTNDASVLNFTATEYSDTQAAGTLTLSDISTGTGIDVADLTTLIAVSSTPLETVVNMKLIFGLRDNAGLKNYRNVMPLDPMGQWSSDFVFAWSDPVGKVRVLDQVSPELNAMNTYFFNSHDNYNTFENGIKQVTGKNYYNYSNLSKLMQYNGQIVTLGGQNYKMEFTFQQEQAEEIVISVGQSAFFNGAVAAMNCASYYNDWNLYLQRTVRNVSCSLTLEQSGTLRAKISGGHAVLMDAPYSMFVIPYATSTDDYDVWGTGDEHYGQVLTKRGALIIATQLAERLGDKLFDLQLLPYMPQFLDWFDIDSTPILLAKDKVHTVDYDDIERYDPDTATYKNASCIIYPRLSNFSFTIDKELNMEDEIKIESECNFYRLCSPNYNGLFDFNLAKNGGYSGFINVDCTYKPISPFIRVTPEFNLLYGQNFLDGRGLICGGDFSLPRLKDAWITYQQNNKNYANIFARDIQNLDVSQRHEMVKESVTLGAGVAGGGATGAMAGAKFGGPYGAIAGAALGTAVGAVGGLIDASLGYERRAEAKDYAIDRFNLSLGNIRAIPDSLVRNSAFTIINKIFPFIEYYSCTDEEKEALRKKITYDGMTVGRIDHIGSYMGHGEKQYFKGQLIKAEGINEDNHYINALYEEIAKGVYI